MAVREGRWDCLYCEARAIKGRHLICPHCNRPRPAGVTFYLPDNEAEIVEEFLIERAHTGPDWICPFCESSNANNAGVCQRCMAPIGTEVTAQTIRQYSLGEVAREGDLAAQEKAAYEQAPEIVPAPPSRSRRRLLLAGVLLFLLLCLCGSLAFFFTRGSDSPATVVDTRWQRVVEIEVYETVVEEGWSLPAAARVLDSYEEIRAYENVQVGTELRQRQVAEQVVVGQRDYVCGQEDLGNGFFQDIYCSEPIYETRYRTETYEEPVYEEQPVYDIYYIYEAEVWKPLRTEEAAGADLNTFWPQASLAADEREGERRERYLTIFQTADGEVHELELNYAEWLQYDIGDEVTLEINRFGDVTGVSP